MPPEFSVCCRTRIALGYNGGIKNPGYAASVSTMCYPGVVDILDAANNRRRNIFRKRVGAAVVDMLPDRFLDAWRDVLPLFHVHHQRRILKELSQFTSRRRAGKRLHAMKVVDANGDVRLVPLSRARRRTFNRLLENLTTQTVGAGHGWHVDSDPDLDVLDDYRGYAPAHAAADLLVV